MQLHPIRIVRVTFVAILWTAATGLAADEQAPTADQLQSWGEQALELIDRELWIADRGLYAERTGRGPQEPAFMWGCGVQLSALNAAARLDPEKFSPRLNAYADALDAYWKEHRGVYGYDVLPAPTPPDRYYDDNAWVVLALVELYELTGEERRLDRAEETLRFVFTGEDQRLGGGLYWREKERSSKNTCTNAPAIVGALRLVQCERSDSWRAAAERTDAWTVKMLQDDDGLYLDNVHVGGERNGEIDRRKFSYNTALMIRANLLFHQLTGDERRLAEAQRMGRAAQREWVDPATGGIADGGRFAHLLVDAFLELHAADGDDHWLDASRRSLGYVHEHLRDGNGRYSPRWDRPARGRGMMLLDQASVARAMLATAKRLRDAESARVTP
jgi:uncharacterized protein YyaL (SSP411 family)